MQHQIVRASYRLRLQEQPDESGLAGYQRDFQARLAPMIGHALDSVIKTRLASNQVLRVPRLRLDLGKLSEHWDDSELLRKLENQLTDQLHDLLPQALSLLQWQHKSYQSYMLQGRWPVGSAFSGLTEAEQWLEHSQDVQRSVLAFMGSQLANRTLWQRIVLQHSVTTLRQLLAVALANSANKLTTDFNRATPLTLASVLWLVCASAVAGHPSRVKRDVLEQWKSAPVRAEIALLPASLNAHFESLSKWLNSVVQKNKQPQANSWQKSAASSSETVPTKWAGDEHELASVYLLVSGAGVVLMHPWLAMLFERCGCMRDGQFIDEQAQCCALFILHYAIYGEAQNNTVVAPENDLLLAKMLTGWPRLQPSPVSWTLTTAQCTHVEACLQAMIGHWQAIGNTSVQGFRESFLQREGTLESMDERYRLKVEQRARDILLDQLPWSLSVAKLPWLDAPLFVEWR